MWNTVLLCLLLTHKILPWREKKGNWVWIVGIFGKECADLCCTWRYSQGIGLGSVSLIKQRTPDILKHSSRAFNFGVERMTDVWRLFPAKASGEWLPQSSCLFSLCPHSSSMMQPEAGSLVTGSEVVREREPGRGRINLCGGHLCPFWFLTLFFLFLVPYSISFS